LILLFCLTWGNSVLAAQDSVLLYGLVIGENGSDDPDKETLHFADDDAINNALLLNDLGATWILLTSPDADTKRLYPTIPATEPTRRALFQAAEKLNQDMQQKREQGFPVQLMIFYAGHGDVQHNQGYVQLADSRLNHDGFRDFLGQFEADVVHVIVDACKSYFLVFDRGPGGERKPAEGRFPDDSDDTYPAHVGFLLSASSDQASHEWEAWQAGIFSHEIRSALRGAADLNSDGVVTYEETTGFIYAANRSIPNARYRPRVWARAPGGKALSSATLVNTSGRYTSGSCLTIEPGLTAHLFIEDAQGNRIVDLHPAEDLEVKLLLPSRRPLFIRKPGQQQEFSWYKPGDTLLKDLTPDTPRVRQRGAEHVAFSSIHKEPFDISSLSAYRVSLTDEDARLLRSPPASWDWLPATLLITAGVCAVGGGVFTGLAANERQEVGPRTPNLERIELNQKIDRLNTGAVTLYTLAAATLTGWLLWLLWPEDLDAEVKVIGPTKLDMAGGLKIRF
jgi:hypothetical protein